MNTTSETWLRVTVMQIWTNAPIGDIFGVWDKMNEARCDGDYALEDKHLSDSMKLYITRASKGEFTLEQTVDIAKMFNHVFERPRPLREQASLLLSSIQDVEKLNQAKRERGVAKEHSEKVVVQKVEKSKPLTKGDVWPYVAIAHHFPPQ